MLENYACSHLWKIYQKPYSLRLSDKVLFLMETV
jgi:hypothetical protein